jgi:excisionase family DNA binding protein
MFEQRIKSENQILMKASEVAKRLNISRSMVYKLVVIGELPCVRISHSVRVRPEDLDKFVSEHVSG